MSLTKPAYGRIDIEGESIESEDASDQDGFLRNGLVSMQEGLPPCSCTCTCTLKLPEIHTHNQIMYNCIIDGSNRAVVKCEDNTFEMKDGTKVEKKDVSCAFFLTVILSLEEQQLEAQMWDTAGRQFFSLSADEVKKQLCKDGLPNSPWWNERQNQTVKVFLSKRNNNKITIESVEIVKS